MSNDQFTKQYQNFLRGLLGCFILILGITLILKWWGDVVTIFKGLLGIGLALAGLLVLYSLKK